MVSVVSHEIHEYHLNIGEVVIAQKPESCLASLCYNT